MGGIKWSFHSVGQRGEALGGGNATAGVDMSNIRSVE